ncbi:hypothetical protein Ais01nite_04340 [Asanoa ishikariensis]|uniref:Uncharacterized protein n=1 Tax=Asanoa ishikariensis TaxID=137265 RepID=A0A1H3TIL3_9ACTN|nr:hypothetical protein [Asanoa ishikariensis]GIF62399.1 hypothetical protein Ais01nite_04340 [Asanoa ishikariensis]SDZ49827.1 hypothetical protein SAMN05421684_5797 [Asanoa ishikariensis]
MARSADISTEDRIRDRRARWCAKWMKLTFTVAVLAFGASWFTAATNLGHPLLPALALLSVLANVVSAVVIRLARRVAPSQFPVTWRGKVGNVGGFGTHLLLTFMSILMFLLATRIFD